MGLSANSIARLRSQMARAEIILFTGAGFSVGASNRQGQRLPTTAQLKEELWELCYPDKTHAKGREALAATDTSDES